MKRKYILILSSLLSHQVLAIQLDKTTTFMESEDEQVSVHVSNVDKNAAHLFTISTAKIDSPYSMTPVVSSEADKNDELLYTPARIIVPANGDINVKFFYHGLKDDKERYYSITWLDVPLSEKMRSTAPKMSEVTTKARLSTVLVVRPRKENFSYTYKNNVLSNVGNTTLRTVAYGPCAKEASKPCEQRVNLTPGKETSFSIFNTASDKFHVGVWHGKNFEQVN